MSIRITSTLLQKIKDYFIDFNNERGGALLIKDNQIIAFLPLDNVSDSPHFSYIFSFDKLNDLLEKYDDYDGFGIIHSHYVSKDGFCYKYLTDGDLNFYKNFASSNSEFKTLIFPIIYLEKGNKEINWYQLVNDECELIECEVI